MTSIVGGLSLLASSSAPGQPAAFDLEATLARVGARLERHFQQSQRVVSTESVLVRSFRHDMRSSGLPQRLEFERRVEVVPSETGVPTITVLRDLRSVNGREPRPRDLDACLTPLPETEDPLTVLLPARHDELEFSLVDLERLDGRPVVRLDFVPLQPGKAEVTWDEDCVHISLPGHSRGEAWVDIESGEVLRLDEHLMRRFEFRQPQDSPRSRRGSFVLERLDVSIRYERVSFEDPAETLTLPRSMESSWVLRGAGVIPRYYRSQQFSNYRRFVTDARVLVAPESVREPK